MEKMGSTHIIPALLFGGLLGVILIVNGASATDTLLAVCGAYMLASILESAFELGATTSVEDKS